jgi:CheY-like chemotaxis protein
LQHFHGSARAPTRQPGRSVPITKRKRILIVDDDPEICEGLADLLVAEGYSVGCAGDGAQALDALASTATDAVLLDLNMPVMTGHEFLGRRAADPRLAKIPVIILSASASLLEATAGTSLLAKPFDIEALLAMLGHRSVMVTHHPSDVVVRLRPPTTR